MPVLAMLEGRIKRDDYTTPKSAIASIRQFVPPGETIWDPFYNDGVAGDYLREVFPDRRIIHTQEDAFTSQVEPDVIITNPPFSIKYECLAWLVGKDVPFACILPLDILANKAIRNVPCLEELQFIIPNGRVNYEMPGQAKSSAFFGSCWVTRGFGLPDRLMLLD